MTDFRALCAELAYELDAETGYTTNDGVRITHPTVVEARAALAQPEPQGPSDEELLRIYGVATPCYHAGEYKRELEFARAVLARWAALPLPENNND